MNQKAVPHQSLTQSLFRVHRPSKLDPSRSGLTRAIYCRQTLVYKWFGFRRLPGWRLQTVPPSLPDNSLTSDPAELHSDTRPEDRGEMGEKGGILGEQETNIHESFLSHAITPIIQAMEDNCLGHSNVKTKCWNPF